MTHTHWWSDTQTEAEECKWHLNVNLWLRKSGTNYTSPLTQRRSLSSLFESPRLPDRIREPDKARGISVVSAMRAHTHTRLSLSLHSYECVCQFVVTFLHKAIHFTHLLLLILKFVGTLAYIFFFFILFTATETMILCMSTPAYAVWYARLSFWSWRFTRFFLSCC